ncbi:hypothetical protein [Nocardiopsis coralliicola]
MTARPVPAAGPAAVLPSAAAPAAGLLLAGLIDDGGLLPPAPLTLFQALQRNRSDRIVGHSLHGLRLLCPVRLLPALAQGRSSLGGPASGPLGALSGVDVGAPLLEIGVVLDSLADAELLGAAPPAGTALVHAEVPAGPAEIARAAAVARAPATAGVQGPRTVFFETEPRDWPDAVAALAGARPLGLLLACRPGGTGAMPRGSALAEVICSCVRADVPFRLPADDHPAVTRGPAVQGRSYYGVFNILLATACAAAGAGAAAAEEVLSCPDGRRIADGLRRVRPAAAARARRILTAAPARSTAEPVRDAAALGLLAAWES